MEAAMYVEVYEHRFAYTILFFVHDDIPPVHASIPSEVYHTFSTPDLLRLCFGVTPIPDRREEISGGFWQEVERR